MHLKFGGEAHHADIAPLADELDRLDAVVARGAFDALEQLRADATSAIGFFDAEGRLGVDMAMERRLFGPDRLAGAQFARPAHAAFDKGAEHQIAPAKTALGVMGDEVVRHAAFEPFTAALWVQAQQMAAKRRHIGGPQAPNFRGGARRTRHDHPPKSANRTFDPPFTLCVATRNASPAAAPTCRAPPREGVMPRSGAKRALASRYAEQVYRA